MSVTTESRVPVVGDRVIATRIPHIDGNPSYSEELRRQVVTVDRINEESGELRFYAEFRAPSSEYSHFWYFTEWKFPEDEEGSTDDVETLRRNISELRTQVNEFRTSFENERNDHNRTRNNFLNSLEIIGDRLNTEAENRGWCDEFDQIVDSVNNTLPGPYLLPERAKEYEVTWTETYTVTVRRSETIRAKGEDEAIDDARDWESADSYMLVDAINCGGYEYDDSDNYEASEQ